MYRQKGKIIVLVCSLLGGLTSDKVVAEDQPIYGYGAANYIAKFTDGNDIGNSQIVYESGGNVGIGTTNPATLLHLYGPMPYIRMQDTFDGVSAASYIGFYDSNSRQGYIGFASTSNNNLYIRNDENGNILILPGTGCVGIGTMSPATLLHLYGPMPYIRMQDTFDGVSAASYIGFYDSNSRQGYIGFASTSNNSLYIRNDENGNILILPGTGCVGIGTTSPDKKLTVRGNILVEDSSGNDVVELGTGLDYSEGFHVSDRKEMTPGSVVIIDADNPGKLTISAQPYDTKVAGIVAGAKGLGSGVKLGVDGFDCNVALAGRVHCNVDATEEAIEAGDLLTTSGTPGYAMKAVDHARAQGAILGKAMQRLEQGKKDQILVLVTLQ